MKAVLTYILISGGVAHSHGSSSNERERLGGFLILFGVRTAEAGRVHVRERDFSLRYVRGSSGRILRREPICTGASTSWVRLTAREAPGKDGGGEEERGRREKRRRPRRAR